MSEELKPCPACGHSAKIWNDRWDIANCVGCDNPNCLLSGPIAEDKKGAVEKWNALPRVPHITPNDADCKGCPERRPGLAWTKEPPKVPGWYWYQCCFSRARIAQIMYRGLDTDRMIASFTGNKEDEWVEDMVALWAGPIPGPEEAV